MGMLTSEIADKNCIFVIFQSGISVLMGSYIFEPSEGLESGDNFPFELKKADGETEITNAVDWVFQTSNSIEERMHWVRLTASILIAAASGILLSIRYMITNSRFGVGSFASGVVLLGVMSMLAIATTLRMESLDLRRRGESVEDYLERGKKVIKSKNDALNVARDFIAHGMASSSFFVVLGLNLVIWERYMWIEIWIWIASLALSVLMSLFAAYEVLRTMGVSVRNLLASQ